MGSINDHKIIAIKSQKYAKALQATRALTEIETQRFGFYLLVIDAVSHIKDIDEIISSIIDTDFCGVVHGIKNNDEGIDAITIDEETNTINLFNFKYRESFKKNGGQKLSDAVDSVKFLSAITNENTSNLDERTKALADDIIERLKSGEVWRLNLYMVSNDNIPLTVDEKFIKNLQEEYDLTVKTIVLDDIVRYTSTGPNNAEASVFLDLDAVMTFEESALASSKSYLFRIPVSDIIRITSTDASLRSKHDLSDLSELKDSSLEMGLLFENVRGYLGKTEYNRNIVSTLQDDPAKFFMYNNGITLTTKNIQAIPKNGGKKLLVNFQGFQIVNGGQTIRSIYGVLSENFDEEKLSTASVLVRAFQTEGDDTLTNNIAEYTNSQNAISASDLKSVSNLQVQIERYFKENGIQYIRKSGDVGADDKTDYEIRVSMERLAQIIFSKEGHPDKASNQKKRLFSKYYDEIFNKATDFDSLIAYVREYEEIKRTYIGRGNPYEQKYFYVLYLNTLNHDIENNIRLVEEALTEYRNTEDIPEARKLIQRAFKDLLDTKMNR